jgi:orotidine-5'-phosphate decarboxylase
MMRAAAEAARDTALNAGVAAPRVVAITVLTSLDSATLRDLGVSREVPAQVEALAALAEQAGLDGVVASPLEIGILRRRHGPHFLIVTPGIRGPESSGRADDQVRTLSAAEALQAGASYLVVGRPIIRAADPRAAAEQILGVAGSTAHRAP